MSDLNERAEKAVMETWVCGIEIDGVRMLCCDERAKGRPGYWKPEDCHCRNSARAVRAITLEEAAKLMEQRTLRHRTIYALQNGSRNNVAPCEHAAAIRKLGEK